MHDDRLELDQRMLNTLEFHSGLGSAQVCQLRFEDWESHVAAPVAPELRAAIEHWSRTGFERVYGRPPNGADWLVPRRSDTSHSHTEGSMYKAFRRACVALGIKTRSPRAVANTFATAHDDSSE
jgi:hypothetical protein